MVGCENASGSLGFEVVAATDGGKARFHRREDNLWCKMVEAVRVVDFLTGLM